MNKLRNLKTKRFSSLTTRRNALKKSFKNLIGHIGHIHFCAILIQIVQTYLLALMTTIFYSFIVIHSADAGAYYNMPMLEIKDKLFSLSTMVFRPLLYVQIFLQFFLHTYYLVLAFFHEPEQLSVHYQGWFTISNSTTYPHPIIEKILRLPEENELYMNTISIHEAGHVVAATLLNLPVVKVNMLPKEAGVTITMPAAGNVEDLEKEILFLLAGAVAEKILLQQISTGNFEPQSDLTIAEDKIRQYRALCLLYDNNNTFYNYSSCMGSYVCYKGTLDFMTETEELLKENKELILTVAKELRDQKILSRKYLSSIQSQQLKRPQFDSSLT